MLYKFPLLLLLHREQELSNLGNKGFTAKPRCSSARCCPGTKCFHYDSHLTVAVLGGGGGGGHHDSHLIGAVLGGGVFITILT